MGDAGQLFTACRNASIKKAKTAPDGSGYSGVNRETVGGTWLMLSRTAASSTMMQKKVKQDAG